MAESYFEHEPSTFAAGIFSVAFGLVTIATLVQIILVVHKAKDRRVWILLPFVLGGICETIGYIARICSIRSPELAGPWIAQNSLILVASALFTITYHLTINRILSVLDARQLSIIPLKWLAKLFVILDMLCFFLKGGGSGLLSRATEDQHEIGRRIVVGGSALQLSVSVFFIVVMAIFEHRLKKNPSIQAVNYRHQPSKYRNWKMILITLYISSVFMVLRCMLLCFEYAQSAEGHIAQYEGYTYVFDATLMFLSMSFFTLENLGSYFYHIQYELRATQGVALEQIGNYSDLKLT